MKIVILPSARDDLADGFDFYERQRAGLGDYFLESLFQTSIHSNFTREFIARFWVFIGCCQNGSPTRLTTMWKTS